MNTKGSSILTKRYKLILSAVHMVYRLVNSTYNVQELTLRLTRLLCQFIKASSSTIYIFDAQKQKKKLVMIAIFDNKINVLKNKKRELADISEQEKKVTQGYIVFEKHVIGLPLVADDNIGAIVIRRRSNELPLTQFDKEMLSVIVEQSVTAIKNIQLYEEQQRITLGSIEFIGKLLEKHGSQASSHTPVHFKIAKSLGEKLNMGKAGIDSLYYASIIHDAGAMDVPYEILSKSSRLTPQEFNIIRKHPARSAELIKPVEFLKPVLPIVLYHHEKYDGTGYPSGLRKEQIPLGARIMAVVDAFEAMTVERPYKKRLTIDAAINELKSHSGTQFDPKVVHAFVELCQQKKFRNNLR